MVDWSGLAKRKYDIKEREAEASRMKARASMLGARTGATQSERVYGEEGLTQQELTRRFPYGLPAYGAETARVTARAAAKGAEARAGAVRLAGEESVIAREFLYGTERPGADDVATIKGMATGEGAAKPGTPECPEGFTWDGKKCVPLR